MAGNVKEEAKAGRHRNDVLIRNKAGRRGRQATSEQEVSKARTDGLGVTFHGCGKTPGASITLLLGIHDGR